MKSYGMEQKLVRLIQAIYSETQLAVLVNGHLSEWFQMTVGNRQGDPLCSGVSVHGNRVNNSRFADDIDILNRAMRNYRIQSTNYIQKVNDRECI